MLKWQSDHLYNCQNSMLLFPEEAAILYHSTWWPLTPDSARLALHLPSPRRPLSWTSTWQIMSSRKGNGDWKFALCNWLCTETSVLPFLLQKHRAQDASSRYKVQVNSNVYFFKIMAIFSVNAYCLLRTQKHLWSVYHGNFTRTGYFLVEFPVAFSHFALC